MNDGNVCHLVDVKRARKNQVHNLADFARITVFERKHRAIAIAVFGRRVCVLEVRERNVFGIGIHLFCRDVRKRAFRSAIRHAHFAHKRRLIFARNVNRRADKILVIRHECGRLDEFCVVGNDLFFPLAVANAQSVLLFVERDLLARLHTFFKQARHLFVNFVDYFSRFLDVLHNNLFESIIINYDYKSTNFLQN